MTFQAFINELQAIADAHPLDADKELALITTNTSSGGYGIGMDGVNTISISDAYGEDMPENRSAAVELRLQKL